MDSEEPSTSLTPPLTPEEARVLGCLIEKERTTPEYYPLSLHQLVAACNQTSNRDPVVAFADSTVLTAIDGLKTRQLLFLVLKQAINASRWRKLRNLTT